MSIIVPRTCAEISAEEADQHREKESRPLEAFRDVPAYVLLGDPGAGKTTAFEAECEALGEKAYFRVITADDFLTFDVSDHPPEWRDKTLFIDGLDEVRAGAQWRKRVQRASEASSTHWKVALSPVVSTSGLARGL